MSSERTDDAVRALENALKVAKNEGEAASVQNALQMVQNYKTMREQVERRNREIAEANGKASATQPLLRDATSKEEEAAPPKLASRNSTEFPPRGPHKTLVGKLTAVECGMPAMMDFKLVAANGTTSLHSDNYYKVQFSALGFIPAGELHPCTDIQGMQAKVEFVEVVGTAPVIIAVELRK
jgi:hypothetical protein